MHPRSSTPLAFPLLALGLTLALAVSAQAQPRSYPVQPVGASATLRVNFGTTPHWASIQGTRVEELPAYERPDYDVFRYGGTYYAYNNNRWYSSPRESGDFTGIDDRAVPNEFSSIPREHWHNYPTAWQDRHDQVSDNTSATLQVNLGGSAHWMGVHGTDVEELPAGERPNFDVFRSGGTYYAHDNNRWYMSRLESGRYTAMDDRDVPGAFSNVPRDHWRSYPAGWQERQPRHPAAPTTMQVDLGYRTRWFGVRGTRVELIRERERPDYDMFRYSGTYYVYANNQWYSSQRGRGQFVAMDARAVPAAVYRVPRQYWRDYPASWEGRDQWDRRDHRERADGYGNRNR